MTTENEQLRTIVEQMKALGFAWRASFKPGRGAKFHVRFEENVDRPDRIAQTVADYDLLEATREASRKTMAFIAEVGEGWHTRPIKVSESK